eukprot:TRINITY_DN8208_c0_g1_i1.p2 TRINITY_DN8208_c0_g1~~TRINITY_DN8208_c0_g1_i1.p2  ORF type:complete len:109 (-),score=1.84 TRINITY_DN8208_c0_g1_i1:718-1044(-)
MTLTPLKISKKLGKMKCTHSTPTKITHLGELTTINMLDIIIIILMVMLFSVSHHTHSLEKSNVITSSSLNKSGAGINHTENYPQSTHSPLLMLMINSSLMNESAESIY